MPRIDEWSLYFSLSIERLRVLRWFMVYVFQKSTATLIKRPEISRCEIVFFSFSFVIAFYLRLLLFYFQQMNLYYQRGKAASTVGGFKLKYWRKVLRRSREAGRYASNGVDSIRSYTRRFESLKSCWYVHHPCQRRETSYTKENKDNITLLWTSQLSSKHINR